MKLSAPVFGVNYVGNGKILLVYCSFDEHEVASLISMLIYVNIYADTPRLRLFSIPGKEASFWKGWQSMLTVLRKRLRAQP